MAKVCQSARDRRCCGAGGYAVRKRGKCSRTGHQQGRKQADTSISGGAELVLAEIPTGKCYYGMVQQTVCRRRETDAPDRHCGSGEAVADSALEVCKPG